MKETGINDTKARGAHPATASRGVGFRHAEPRHWTLALATDGSVRHTEKKRCQAGNNFRGSGSASAARARRRAIISETGRSAGSGESNFWGSGSDSAAGARRRATMSETGRSAGSGESLESSSKSARPVCWLAEGRKLEPEDTEADGDRRRVRRGYRRFRPWQRRGRRGQHRWQRGHCLNLSPRPGGLRGISLTLVRLRK